MAKKTNSLLDILTSQASNAVDYPNINPAPYDPLSRRLGRFWDLFYGVNKVNDTTWRFLVLAVQGAHKDDKNPPNNLRRNCVFIANQFFSPTQGASFTLNTPANTNITVTLKKVYGRGAFQMNQDLTEDVVGINQGTFPYLEFKGTFK